MKHVEQLEREAEQTRLQIADTLDELKESMTPAHVLHQLADRISDGAPADFARNLKGQAVNNPLSVALVGAGLAWLMLSPRESAGNFMRRSKEQLQGASDAAQGGLAEAVDSGRQTAESIADTSRQTAADAASAVRGVAGSVSDSIQRTASSGYQTASSGYNDMAETARRTVDTISNSAREAKQRTLQSGSALLDFCREQPMVIAGLGLVLGAVVGALLPGTETEDQLVGEASDRTKESVQNVAADQYERAKNVGERALDAAKDEAGKTEAREGTGEREKATGSEHKEHAHAEAENATLVPSDQSELETRGQPWTPDNAPV